jgi:hypothetical protein
MYAVEFTTTIKDGVIEVPDVHLARFKDNVKVILLAEEDDIIAKLLAHPLKVPGFTPLTREEAHSA